MKFDRRLLDQLKTVRGLFILTIGLGGLVGLLIIAQARLLSTIIDRVFLQAATLSDVSSLLITLLVVIGMRVFIAWGSDFSAAQVAARIKTDLRQRVFEKLLALGPAYLHGERTGELTNTVNEGIEALDAYFSQYIPQLILAVLIPLSILMLVFPIDLLSGLILLLTAPLIPFFMVLIGQAAAALTQRQYQALSFMSAHFLDVLQGLTTLKILGRSRAQIDTIAQVSDRFRTATLSVLRVAFLSAFALEMIATLSTAIVAVEVGLRLLSGALHFEQAFFVLVLAPDFYAPLRLLGTRFHAGQAGVAAAQRVFEILETPTPSSVTADRVPPVTRHWSVIRFDDIHFAYEDQRAALNGVSFEIKAGQHIALIGATGAGKSTLAQLLLRFSEPQQGTLWLDDVPLRDLDARAWREQIAWVPQRPYLFHDTIAANILMAKPTASLREIQHAAQLAHADEFIRAMPQGYDTLIGERGARLSGGQAQRLALTRAFLKNAPLLILDEATSNLDVENEALLQDSIGRLLADRTALIITHRLNTVVRADLIIVLDQGRVIESGPHAALLQQGGRYTRLVSAAI